MPLIQVRVIKDVFSKEQKREIISKLTDAMVSIEGENMRKVTLCLVEEVESGDWGSVATPLPPPTCMLWHAEKLRDGAIAREDSTGDQYGYLDTRSDFLPLPASGGRRAT